MSKRSKKIKIVKEAFDRLTEILPTKKFVDLKLSKNVKINKDSIHGLCEIKFNYITITLNKNLSEACLMDTLIHEYAHAMMFDKSDGTVDISHNYRWGICFAKAYSTIFDAYD